MLIVSLLKLFHISIILYVSTIVCSANDHFKLEIMIFELLLTLTTSIISTKRVGRMSFNLFQVFCSLSLLSILNQHYWRFISGFFLAKIFYVYLTLGQIAEQLFASKDHSNLIKIAKKWFTILRFTAVQYHFLGILLFAYKLFTMNDGLTKLPADHVLLFKMIEIATSLGCGDQTPKTKTQIYYFIFAVPFACASFIIYFNSIIPHFMEFVSILEDIYSNKNKEWTLNNSVWGKKDRQNYYYYIQKVNFESKKLKELKESLSQNWISFAAVKYEQNLPLIREIDQLVEGKQLDLQISSKIETQFFPKGWKIIKKGQKLQSIFYLREGEVIQGFERRQKGFIFNKDIFMGRQQCSEVDIVANSFVIVFSLKRKDLVKISPFQSIRLIRASVNNPES